MIIRGNQHVDEWAGVAVDYLDGRLDPGGREAVEVHLSGCPECAARLRKQQYVVRLLQETVLDDPPEDLEYRSIGELVFPSPGGQPLALPTEAKKPATKSGGYRLLRPWIPPAVAVVVLVAAVVGYGIARSGPGADVASDSFRAAIPTTIAAGSATTAAATFGESATVAGANLTTTTAAGATTTAALAGATPSSETPVSTLAATQDPKAMIRALEDAQAPTLVSFQTAVAAPPAGGQGPTGTATETTAAGSTDTTGAVSPTTTAAGSDTTSATGDTTVGTVSAEKAEALLNAIKEFTGLEPLDKSLWLGGPTFAVFLPREDAAELVDLVRSVGSSLGLTVSLGGAPPVKSQGSLARLLEHKSLFPVLAAHRALQPSIWNYDFTTSTLGSETANGQPGTAKALPDEAGTHVIVVIVIAE